MPEETFAIPKGVQEYLGLTEDQIKDVDVFKSAVDEKFVLRANAKDDAQIIKDVTGKVTGSITTKLKANFKAAGIELSGDDIEGKKVEEIVELGFGKLNEAHTTTVTDLKGQIGNSDEEAIKAIQDKLDTEQKSHKEVKDLLDTTKNDFDTFKTEAAGREKTVKIDTFRGQAMDKLKFKEGLTDVEKAGFNSIVNQNFKIELDDAGAAFITDGDGNRIKSEQATGEFKSIDEVFESEATKAKLLASNPHADKNQGTKPTTTTAPETSNEPLANDGLRVRKVHGGAQKAAVGS